MPETIPTLLAPYVREALRSTSLTFVTSTLSNSVNWLLTRLLYAALEGVGEATQGHDSRRSNDVRCKVVFVSLIRPRGLWQELAKKLVRLDAHTRRLSLKGHASRALISSFS